MKKIMIKSILFILLLVGITGCKQVYVHVDKQEVIRSLDFTKYQEKNFLITPGDYGNDYEALGMFSFTMFPEANYEVLKKSDRNKIVMKKWKQGVIEPQEVLDLAYQTAIEKGANAIIHFKIGTETQMRNDGMKNFTLTGIKMDGLLIKRK